VGHWGSHSHPIPLQAARGRQVRRPRGALGGRSLAARGRWARRARGDLGTQRRNPAGKMAPSALLRPFSRLLVPARLPSGCECLCPRSPSRPSACPNPRAAGPSGTGGTAARPRPAVTFASRDPLPGIPAANLSPRAARPLWPLRMALASPRWSRAPHSRAVQGHQAPAGGAGPAGGPGRVPRPLWTPVPSAVFSWAAVALGRLKSGELRFEASLGKKNSGASFATAPCPK
jgi:hypothetical protein